MDDFVRDVADALVRNVVKAIDDQFIGGVIEEVFESLVLNVTRGAIMVLITARRGILCSVSIVNIEVINVSVSANLSLD